MKITVARIIKIDYPGQMIPIRRIRKFKIKLIKQQRKKKQGKTITLAQHAKDMRAPRNRRGRKKKGRK